MKAENIEIFLYNSQFNNQHDITLFDSGITPLINGAYY